MYPSDISQLQTQSNLNPNPKYHFDEQELQKLICNQIALKCHSNNQLSQFCFSQKCKQKFNFICQSSKCQCNVQHLECERAAIQFVLKSLKSRICNTDELKKQVQVKFFNIIDELNILKSQIFQSIDLKFKYMYLVDLERNFVKVLNGKLSPDQFNGQKLNKLRQVQFEKLNKKPPNIDLLMNQLTKFQQKLSQETKQISLKIDLMIDSISEQKIPKEDKFLEVSIIANSKIIKSETQTNKLLDMFAQKKINQMKLMYLASQNNFSVSEFYNKCGSLGDILIICLTEKGKIIGGFTPLTFNPTSQSSNCYVTDPSFQSFLFSLTDNQKFILKDSTHAIYRHQNKEYIQFGYGGQLAICDKSNETKDCFTDFINTSYFNESYSNDKKGFLKLNGNETNRFSCLEWQAWKVKFNQ